MVSDNYRAIITDCLGIDIADRRIRSSPYVIVLAPTI